jgi:hypothetical protein
MYCPSRVDFGANKFKKVIDFYITKYYNISCTDNIIEDILINNLSFFGEPKIKTRHIIGKDLQGLDKTVAIDLVLINNHLSSYYNLILDDIVMAISGFEKDYNKSINKLYLTGGLSRLSGFEKALSDKVSTLVINKSDSNYTLRGLEILLTKGIVHWRIGGLQAFVFQIFLSCNLISKSYEIANETIPKPLCSIASGIEQPHKLCDCFSLQ